MKTAYRNECETFYGTLNSISIVNMSTYQSTHIDKYSFGRMFCAYTERCAERIYRQKPVTKYCHIIMVSRDIDRLGKWNSQSFRQLLLLTKIARINTSAQGKGAFIGIAPSPSLSRFLNLTLTARGTSFSYLLSIVLTTTNFIKKESKYYTQRKLRTQFEHILDLCWSSLDRLVHYDISTK